MFGWGRGEGERGGGRWRRASQVKKEKRNIFVFWFLPRGRQRTLAETRCGKHTPIFLLGLCVCMESGRRGDGQEKGKQANIGENKNSLLIIWWKHHRERDREREEIAQLAKAYFILFVCVCTLCVCCERKPVAHNHFDQFKHRNSHRNIIQLRSVVMLQEQLFFFFFAGVSNGVLQTHTISSIYILFFWG